MSVKCLPYIFDLLSLLYNAMLIIVLPKVSVYTVMGKERRETIENGARN